MQDRGEKIVTLAREILRSDDAPRLPAESSARITMSFRVLCLATMLAAVGGAAVTSFVAESRRPLNHYEKTEIDALIFYAAKQKGLDETQLRRELLMRFRLPSYDAMTEGDFTAVRAWLQNRID